MIALVRKGVFRYPAVSISLFSPSVVLPSTHASKPAPNSRGVRCSRARAEPSSPSGSNVGNALSGSASPAVAAAATSASSVSAAVCSACTPCALGSCPSASLACSLSDVVAHGESGRATLAAVPAVAAAARVRAGLRV
eukprot:scaffold27377_cov61-Phaeocystis_antarctica.AAC.8